MNDGVCPHLCCKLWLQNACSRLNIVPVEKQLSLGNKSIKLLDDVTSNEVHKHRSTGHLEQSTSSVQETEAVHDRNQKKFIQKSLLTLTTSRGIFKERMEELKKKILQFLHVWCDLTPDEWINLHNNV